MAIFFNHIKGCGASSTGQAGSTKDLWTWIKFADITGQSVNTDLTNSNKSVEYLPSILLYSSNDATAVKYDFGKIITSNAVNQKIEENFIFTENLYFKKDRGLCWSEVFEPHILQCSETELTLRHPSKIGIIASETILPYKIKIDDNNTTTTVIDPAATYTFHTTGTAKIEKCLYIGPDKEGAFNPSIASDGTIKAQNKCEALFFNATSDRRAKENITPVQFSALTTVNSLPIYSFNYLSQPEAVTIGLIAQEAAVHSLDGFNMVDNLNASGQGSDMMQMKESKLVYVLWKAVQELSAEVEELKAKIASLK